MLPPPGNLNLSVKVHQEAVEETSAFIVQRMDYFDKKMSDSSGLKSLVAQKGNFVAYCNTEVFGYPLYAVIKREDTKTGIPTIGTFCLKLV